jgi:hypothetical protein
MRGRAVAELAHLLVTYPEALTAIIEELPDPRAAAVVKALAPVIEQRHRRTLQHPALAHGARHDHLR